MFKDTISEGDELYAGDRRFPPTHEINLHHYEMYMRCGAEMGDYAKAMAPEAAQILELPCGFGRVTRHLIAHFPEAHVCCVDVIPDAIEFQSVALSTEAILIDPPSFEYAAVADERFDLSIIGALMTHLNEENNRVLLGQIVKKTRRGGRIVTSTRGEAAHVSLQQRHIYQTSEEDRTRMLADYEVTGYAFAPYLPGHNFEETTAEIAGDYYGIALVSPSWMFELGRSLGLRLVDYRMGGWDRHLDLFTFEKI